MSAITPSAGAVGGDVLPDVIEISFRFRVEVIAGHESGWARRAVSLFSRKRANTSSPGINFHFPALDLIVAAIQNVRVSASFSFRLA